MNIIVAGQKVVTATEFVEAAIGFDFDLGDPPVETDDRFVPGLEDLRDLAEFVEDVTDPAGSALDAENALHFRALTSNVVALSQRRGRVVTKAVAA